VLKTAGLWGDQGENRPSPVHGRGGKVALAGAFQRTAKELWSNWGPLREFMKETQRPGKDQAIKPKNGKKASRAERFVGMGQARKESKKGIKNCKD